MLNRRQFNRIAGLGILGLLIGEFDFEKDNKKLNLYKVPIRRRHDFGNPDKCYVCNESAFCLGKSPEDAKKHLRESPDYYARGKMQCWPIQIRDGEVEQMPDCELRRHLVSKVISSGFYDWH